MKTYLSLFGLAAAVFFVGTSSAAAYVTTEQTATQLTPTTAMYSVTYTFGPSPFNFQLPAHTSRGTGDSENLTLTYEILEDGETRVETGDTAAIVFSSTPLINNEYHLRTGQRQSFTLVAFFRTDPGTTEADYALKVTGLPFNEVRDKETFVENKLTQGELSTYITPEIELNELN